MSMEFLTTTREEQHLPLSEDIWFADALPDPPVRTLVRISPMRNELDMADLTGVRFENEGDMNSTEGSISRIVPDWFPGLATEVLNLTDLPHDWDSYGADPLSLESAEAALGIILRIARKGLSRPVVSPVSAGGVVFEWESPTAELSVTVHGANSASFYFDDEHEGPIEELELLAEPLLAF